MTIRLVPDEKIAETSSKGNQEKRYDQAVDYWYKLDPFGYEALTETVVSVLLEQSNLETDTPFTFVRYQMERLQVYDRERIGCSSRNFLHPDQALITVNRLVVQPPGKIAKREVDPSFQRQKTDCLSGGNDSRDYRAGAVSAIPDSAF